jgi:hypothetical protein
MTTICTILLAASIAIACSGKDAKSYPDDGGIDGGDTDVDTDTDTDTDSDTDSDTETGENETPPELPEICSADLMDLPASGDGDGRWPEIAAGTETLFTWAYDEQEPTADWDIQIASFDLGPDGGVGDPVEPMEDSIVAEMPFLVERGDGFGIGWLDTRWDLSCTTSDQDACNRDIAFITLDGAGQPANPIPNRVTYDAVINERPAVAATADGYLVVWAEQDGPTADILVAALDANGDPGVPQLISGDNPSEIERRPAIAAAGTTAVATWLADDQNHVLAQALDLDGNPVGDPQAVDEGNLCSAPKIAGGTDDFVVAWSTMKYDDFEVYTRKLDGSGAPLGEPHRATWTTEHAEEPAVAWSGSDYALIWLSPEKNGTGSCTHESCMPQTFGALLDDDGAIASQDVLLSDDPNRCSVPDLTWDGSGWLAAWELRRDMRQQVYYGRMVCE